MSNKTMNKKENAILSVAEYPWVGDPINPANREEYADLCGQIIGRLRVLIADENIDIIYNMGEGIQSKPMPLDIEKMRQKGHGPFGVFTAFEPRDLDLYRNILPEHFDLPKQPVVSLVTLDYNQKNPIIRYTEGMVLLKGVGADNEETWYVHSMPVEDWLMLLMGHDWGDRKDLYDIAVSRTKTSVLQKNGEQYMSLEMTGQPCSDEIDWLIPQEHCGGTNNMSTVWPADPSLVLRFSRTGKSVVLDDQKEMVSIQVHPDVDWAGLVPENGIAPGYFLRFSRFDSEGGDSFIKKLRRR